MEGSRARTTNLLFQESFPIFIFPTTIGHDKISECVEKKHGVLFKRETATSDLKRLTQERETLSALSEAM